MCNGHSVCWVLPVSAAKHCLSVGLVHPGLAPAIVRQAFVARSFPLLAGGGGGGTTLTI